MGFYISKTCDLISMHKQCLGESLCTLRTYICTCYIKQLVIKTRLFIHADIVALVSKFVVVAILSEWWSVPTTADHCGYIPGSSVQHCFSCIKNSAALKYIN